MAGTRYIKVTETTDGGRTYSQRLCEDANDFTGATLTLHMWLWLTQSQRDAASVIMAWMRGEAYSDHSVSVRHYVPGTVGHWYEIFYRA